VAKVALAGTLAQTGLALATALGAWVNLLIVLVLAARAKYMVFDRPMQLTLLKFALAGLLLAAVLWAVARFAAPVLLVDIRTGREELTLALLVAAGALTYAVTVLVLFGRRWLTTLVR
jgi:putative peptidoglycan lipid II flippase